MDDRIAVIESDEYRQEVQAIMDDRIAWTMAGEILAGMDSGQAIDLDSHGFMLAAMRTYRERGGVHGRTIGGPARAIRQLVEQHR